MDNPSTANRSACPAKATRFCLLVLLFLAVLGARSWMIHEFGDSMPYWDQWGGESSILVAAENDSLTFKQLVSAHNEHRILFPRLFFLAIFQLNGSQWDNLPTLYAMAVITAAAITLLAGIFLHLTRWHHWQVILPTAALLYALPLTWLNMVWGFQGQFHFQIFFAIAALAGLGLGRPWHAAWWLGVATALCAIFTSGSGFLVAACILFLHAIRAIRNRGFDKKSLPTLAVTLGILIAGGALLVHVDAHDRLKAASLSDFFTATLKNFAWPWHDHPAVAFLIYTPLVIVLIRYLLGAKPTTIRSHELIILLGSFIATQLLAIGYSRGINGIAPHARYFDLHLLGILTNIFALLLLLLPTLTLKNRRVAVLRQAAAVVWMCVVGAGLLSLSITHFNDRLPDWKSHAALQQENLLNYLASDDPTHLENKERLAIPHGNAKILIHELRKPQLRRILPAILQLPSGLDATAREGSFQTNDLPKEIAPAPARLAHYSCFVNNGDKGRLVTELIHPTASHLLFWHAGYQATGSLKINFLNAEGDFLQRVKFADIDLPRQQRGWRQVITPAPDQPFRIEAIDQRNGGWFAFTEPRSIGRLSALTIRYGHLGRLLTLITLPLLISLALISRLSPRSE